MISRDFQHFSFSFLADSDPKNGAINRNATGSSFTVRLNEAIVIPDSATNCHVIVRNAVIWNTVPNIREGINNKFYITVSGLPSNDPDTQMVIDIPTGLYDVNTLSAKISTELISKYGESIPEDLIQIFPDLAENKTVIKFTVEDTSIDFTKAKTIREVLGFNSEIVANNVIGFQVPYFIKSDNVANFNNIDYFLIRCSNLLSHGIERNDQLTGVMARIDVNVPVNYKLTYDPRQAVLVSDPGMKGLHIDRMTFELLDQNAELVDTRGEFWSVLFEMHYDLPSHHITDSM